MKPRQPRRSRCFAGLPKALRRRLIEILDRRDFDAFDLAAIAFWEPLIIRPGLGATRDQIASVRRALRALIASGKVEVRHRYRRRTVYSLVRGKSSAAEDFRRDWLEAIQIE